MKNFIIIFAIFCFFACNSKELLPECEGVTYTQESNAFTITQKIVFDTSANLIQVTVVNDKTSEPIKNATVKLEQNNGTKEVLTNQLGEAVIFENNFSGLWQLTISHPDFNCLKVKDVDIDGGQYVVVRLT